MSKKRYDPYEGADRVLGMGEKADPEQLRVMVLHYGLERELQSLIAHIARRPPRIAGFMGNAYMLHAIWDVPDDRADRLLKALGAFNELRNKIAHGNGGIDKCRENLIAAYRELEPNAPEDPTYARIAHGICAYMGFGMMPSDVEWLLAELDSLELQIDEEEEDT